MLEGVLCLFVALCWSAPVVNHRTHVLLLQLNIKLLQKIKMTICNHQAYNHFILWHDALLWWFANLENGIVTDGTECPKWDCHSTYTDWWASLFQTHNHWVLMYTFKLRQKGHFLMVLLLFFRIIVDTAAESSVWIVFQKLFIVGPTSGHRKYVVCVILYWYPTRRRTSVLILLLFLTENICATLYFSTDPPTIPDWEHSCNAVLQYWSSHYSWLRTLVQSLIP